MISLAGISSIETERLVLRAPQGADWEAWRAFAVSNRARFIGGAMDNGMAWRAFGHAIGHWALRGYGSFIFTLKGSDQAIGMVGPWHPFDWPEPEIGWTIWRSEYEGRGLAYEAALAARQHAYDTLGWDTAVSYIHPDNHRSIALAKRLGAHLDEDAAWPKDEPCETYRHPSPDAVRAGIAA